jgi:2-oxo-4-hydroxy-4-carboxy-5-ureidoimidazoline decarboxylase
MTVALLDRMDEAQARGVLFQCCGSHSWVDQMLARRPFGSDERLLHSADEVWWGLTRQDWLEAFGHHPRIGEGSPPGPSAGQGDRWASEEQAGAAGADPATVNALAEYNSAYEDRFGHVFLICASGLDSAAMLQTLQARYENPANMELRIAAGEQAKITRLRLQKLETV